MIVTAFTPFGGTCHSWWLCDRRWRGSYAYGRRWHVLWHSLLAVDLFEGGKSLLVATHVTQEKRTGVILTGGLSGTRSLTERLVGA